MGKSLYFFAADDDIQSVLNPLFGKYEVHIYRCGRVREPIPEPIAPVEMQSGTADAEQEIGGVSYLILPADVGIKTQSYDLVNGARIIVIDQFVNNDSVVLCPLGRRADNIVIAGTVGTAWRSDFSDRFLRDFAAGFRKHFVKVRAFWVGPKALAILRSGGRLTQAVQSPRAYDLKEVRDGETDPDSRDTEGFIEPPNGGR